MPGILPTSLHHQGRSGVGECQRGTLDEISAELEEVKRPERRETALGRSVVYRPNAQLISFVPACTAAYIFLLSTDDMTSEQQYATTMSLVQTWPAEYHAAYTRFLQLVAFEIKVLRHDPILDFALQAPLDSDAWNIVLFVRAIMMSSPNQSTPLPFTDETI